MITYVNGPDYVCSKCKSVNRFFNRLDGHGRNYRECADCGHNDRLPEMNHGGYNLSDYTPPKSVEY